MLWRIFKDSEKFPNGRDEDPDPTSRLSLFVAQTKVTGTPIRRADTLLFCHLCFADRLQWQREKEGGGGRERERGFSSGAVYRYSY